MVQDALTVLENRTQQKDENIIQFMFEIMYLSKRVDDAMPEKKVISYFMQAVRSDICDELV